MNMENNTSTIPEKCQACVLKQTDVACQFSKLLPTESKIVLHKAQEAIEGSAQSGIIVQHIYRIVADEIGKIKNTSESWDAYKEVKDLSNQVALSQKDEFEKIVESAPDRLKAGIQLAAAGNIIDFGAFPDGEIDIANELKTLMKSRFDTFDIEPLKERLNNAQSLLYVCDNCGEIVCDTVLLKEIQSLYPDLNITIAMRDKPIINDATVEDAIYVGLDKYGKVISSGSPYPGTILNETSDEFTQFWNSADIVLTKGQGNFETLQFESDERLFFLFRVKCDYLTDALQVAPNVLMLSQASQLKHFSR